MKDTFDMLYERSKKNCLKGMGLFEIVISRNNILLAYRNIKTNKGSKTKGTDKQTIEEFDSISISDFIEKIRTALNDYKPGKVRRIIIEKESGGHRPLGIPTMIDRIIQQMFKQVLEPIVEAKSNPQSYGFRANRSAHYAMARCQFLVNKVKLYYVVDIDIKSFFDEVNHHKLIQQLYTIGVKDERVLAIIGKMLKAPILGEGVPKMGVPQGGVLSTLLSCVVLNELDWWVSNQWESFKTVNKYANKRCRIQAIKKSNLKEMYIVRYADDFKIFTRKRSSAYKVMNAVTDFLDKRLNLRISPDKSQITNLKRKRSSFLGFEIKAIKKRNKYIARTYVDGERKKRIRKKLVSKVKTMQKQPTKANVEAYNEYVVGIQDYYQYATLVNLDFARIYYSLLLGLHNRLKINFSYGSPERPSELYKKRYKNNYKTYTIDGISLFPLADIQMKLNMSFTQTTCNYSKEGRKEIHENIPNHIQKVINKLSKIEYSYNTLKYCDNLISKYSMQRGKCAITGVMLESGEVYCHHKHAKHLNGDDSFANLVIIHKDVGALIQSDNTDEMKRYLKKLGLNGKQLDKINNFREKWNLPYITNNY